MRFFIKIPLIYTISTIWHLNNKEKVSLSKFLIQDPCLALIQVRCARLTYKLFTYRKQGYSRPHTRERLKLKHLHSHLMEMPLPTPLPKLPGLCLTPPEGRRWRLGEWNWNGRVIHWGEAAPLHAIDSTTLSFSQPEHRYTFYIYLYIYSIAPGNATSIIKTCYIHEQAFCVILENWRFSAD